jgi:flagellar motility protein MotE (MotC chaperone)
LTTALNEKIRQLESSNLQLQKEKKYSDELNDRLKTTLKKLSDAEVHLKVERDWLAEQVEKKSLEVLETIEQLMKAENAKS